MYEKKGGPTFNRKTPGSCESEGRRYYLVPESNGRRWRKEAYTGFRRVGDLLGKETLLIQKLLANTTFKANGSLPPSVSGYKKQEASKTGAVEG